MTSSSPSGTLAATDSEHIVIVGASLAGLRAAEELRREGFGGQLTLIGDESYEPYDRPPLSKHVLSGWLPADHTPLARFEELNAVWRLGVPAISLDLSKREVELADGQRVGFARLLIATGTRARPWPYPEQASLDGVLSIRGLDDARVLRQRLANKPTHVLVIGGGFIGSKETIMTQKSLFKQVLNPANRPNPYPIYAQLREQPVALQEDGAYVISTYKDVSALLHDPRISSDMRKSKQVGARPRRMVKSHRSRPSCSSIPPTTIACGV